MGFTVSQMADNKIYIPVWGPGRHSLGPIANRAISKAAQQRSKQDLLQQHRGKCRPSEAENADNATLAGHKYAV